MPTNPKLILASQSAARIKMLCQAELAFKAMAAHIDEDAITAQLLKKKANPERIAMELAQGKALAISQQKKGVLVVGADQVLLRGKLLINKAKTKNEAFNKLKLLQGKAHKLISAVCVAKDNEILWKYSDKASLKMRALNNAFLKDYCAKAGPALTRAVGAYEFEGLGAWLFEKVEGDIYTIMGMPLLPLLRYLNEKHGFGP